MLLYNTRNEIQLYIFNMNTFYMTVIKSQKAYYSFIIALHINLEILKKYWYLIQVRAASVYALGTFINSVTTRSEHANNIDQIIAMTLINTVSHDMCPLVRKVSQDCNLESIIIGRSLTNRYEIVYTGISCGSPMDGVTFRKLLRYASHGRGE